MPQDAAVTEAPGGAGRHAAAPEELHPGEAAGTLDDLGDLAYGKLIPDAADFTAQWQQIQFRFVDDPQASVTEAAEVVAQVTAKLEAAIQERQRAIEARQQAIQERQRSLRGRWGEGTQADTETLRETLRMYRAFLDQLIGPKG
jgi:cytochrome c556